MYVLSFNLLLIYSLPFSFIAYLFIRCFLFIAFLFTAYLFIAFLFIAYLFIVFLFIAYLIWLYIYFFLLSICFVYNYRYLKMTNEQINTNNNVTRLNIGQYIIEILKSE